MCTVCAYKIEWKKKAKVINFSRKLSRTRPVCGTLQMHHAVSNGEKLQATEKPQRLPGDKKKKKKHRQMSILSNSSNASARHKIDSKLRTMRMRITGNSVGRRGAEMASFYIFSKACYLHKDYIKLLEEIFPKPPAHSRRWCFSPSPSASSRTNSRL